MDIPRALIYEDRTDIQEYGVYDFSSLNHIIYEKWMLDLPDLNPFERGIINRRLKVFNDAYYICTLILMHPTNPEFASYANNRCDYPSVVFPIVYLYISKIRGIGLSSIRLLHDIMAGLKYKGKEGNLTDLINVTKTSDKLSLSLTEFKRREMTFELLSSINWYKVTDNFKKESIYKIIRYIANSEREWVMMLNAIKNDVSEFEWEFNSNLDYYDDLGRLCHDTPKDMSQIYKYCEELKDKFNEEPLPVHEFQTSSEKGGFLPHTEIIKSDKIVKKTEKALKGRPKAKPFKSFIKSETPDCFVEILHNLLNGKRGQDAAQIITACIDHWIDRPATKSVVNEFNNIHYTAFNEAMKKAAFKEESLNLIRKDIELKIEQKKQNPT